MRQRRLRTAGVCLPDPGRSARSNDAAAVGAERGVVHPLGATGRERRQRLACRGAPDDPVAAGRNYATAVGAKRDGTNACDALIITPANAISESTLARRASEGHQCKRRTHVFW